MPKIKNVEAKKLIDAYVVELPLWEQKIFKQLRRLIHEADKDIKEDWKWGAPAFTRNGLICFVWGFQKWVNMTFFQGALIRDQHKLFQETANDRSRTIKFFEGDEVPEEKLLDYLRQSVKCDDVGERVELKPQSKPPIRLPADMKVALSGRKLLDVYLERPYYQKAGYIRWLSGAKTPETRTKRMKAMLTELKDGTYMPPKRLA